MRIFIVQGAFSGVISTAAGCHLGLLVACNVDVIVPAIRRALNVSFLPGSIGRSILPGDPQSGRHRAITSPPSCWPSDGHALPQLARQPTWRRRGLRYDEQFLLRLADAALH